MAVVFKPPSPKSQVKVEVFPTPFKLSAQNEVGLLGLF
jgi:hypothetical protein